MARPGTWVTLYTENMGNSFLVGLLSSLLIIETAVGPGEMWESRQRFPRMLGRVEILILDFQAFQLPSFPQALFSFGLQQLLNRR